jgi:MipA family protein
LRHTRLTTFIAALFAATSAIAQDEPAKPNSDSLTIGVGAAIVPRYEGADENTIVPAAAIRGSYKGFAFSTVGTALYTDFIPAPDGVGTDIILGPVVHVNLNRTSRKRTRNAQIVALGTIDTAIEVGADAGIRRTGVITSDYDTISFDVAVLHDVTNTHDSLIVTPTLAYATPLSETLYVGVSVSGNYVGRGFGRTYFGISPAQSAASGLPVTNPGKGWKDINFGLLGNISLSGDLRRGLSLFALANYERLLGDFKRSPVTRDRNQWFGGVGLAYTF